MSFWIPGRNRNGRRSLFSVGLSPAVVAWIAVVVALLLPLVRWIREWFAATP